MGDTMRPTRTLSTIAAVAAILALLASHGLSAADGFPSSAVKIIVPNPAGGTADALPRIIGDALSGAWKLSLIHI